MCHFPNVHKTIFTKKYGKYIYIVQRYFLQYSNGKWCWFLLYFCCRCGVYDFPVLMPLPNPGIAYIAHLNVNHQRRNTTKLVNLTKNYGNCFTEIKSLDALSPCNFIREIHYIDLKLVIQL